MSELIHDPQCWAVLVILEDYGDYGSDGHRYRSVEEIRDIVESMDVVRGVKLRHYQASSLDGISVILGPKP